jgi:response regulator NasT
MRVWLVDQRQGDACPLEPALRQLAERAGGRLELVGAGPVGPDQMSDLRGRQLDLLVVNESAWPAEPEAQQLLDLDVGIVVVAAEERGERFLALAATYPVGLVARSDDLWPALLTALAARDRQRHWKTQLARLQQRLSDRIVIERAKGILVQRLGIPEADAYKRLRVISRRQRRPIRDIAQSLLDTESLLLPEMDGFADGSEPGGRAPPPG